MLTGQMQSGGQSDKGVKFVAMDEAEQTRSFPVLMVYWFLLAVALAFAFFAAREAVSVLTRKPLQARVVSREVRVEGREMSGRRSKYWALFALAKLRLENLATREVITETLEEQISKEQLVELSFLDRSAPGTVLDPRPDNGWLPVLAFGIGVWMFGVFAWMTKPFADGRGMDGVGVKFLALAVLPIGVAAFGIGQKVMKAALQREAVEGTRREVPVEEFFVELARIGVLVGPDIGRVLDPGAIDYCEYSWEGKKWRSASIWCQPPPGEKGEGRINPANPRDIKWGGEP
jgi:hypothetical protein